MNSNWLMKVPPLAGFPIAALLLAAFSGLFETRRFQRPVRANFEVATLRPFLWVCLVAPFLGLLLLAAGVVAFGGGEGVVFLILGVILFLVMTYIGIFQYQQTVEIKSDRIVFSTKFKIREILVDQVLSYGLSSFQIKIKTKDGLISIPSGFKNINYLNEALGRFMRENGERAVAQPDFE